MPLLHSQPHTTTTRTKPSLLSRIMGPPRRSPRNHIGSNGTTANSRRRHAVAQPVHHHKRKTTMMDKISGALLRMKGTLTHRPGQKAAGTRRMRGTDGKRSRRTATTTRRTKVY